MHANRKAKQVKRKLLDLYTLLNHDRWKYMYVAVLSTIFVSVYGYTSACSISLNIRPQNKKISQICRPLWIDMIQILNNKPRQTPVILFGVSSLRYKI